MTEQFRDPAFLREGIKPGPLKGDEYGEGSYTIVANLEGLPKSVREKVPGGYVVKQYKNEKLSPVGFLFQFDPDSTIEAESVLELRKGFERERGRKPTGDELMEYIAQQDLGDLQPPKDKAEVERILEVWSLPGMAKKLQARQRLVKDYFGKELPDFVVPSQFFVGTDEDGVGHIYEVQNKISPDALKIEENLYTPVDDEDEEGKRIIVEEIEQLAEKVRILYKERLPDIKQELGIFIRLAEQLPDREGWFIDIAYGNIVFTEEGLRYIDTNHIDPLRELQQQEFSDVYSAAKAAVDMFIQSLKNLFARL